MSRRTCPLVLLGVLAGLAESPRPVLGQDRLIRAFAHAEGLEGPPVWAIVQDESGFIWVGAEGGLFRSDGRGFRRWGEAEIRGAVNALALSPDGLLIAASDDGRLHELTGSGARRIPAPRPGEYPRGRAIAFDAGGTLWYVVDGSLHQRDPRGRWRVDPVAALTGERVRLVAPNAVGGVDAATETGLWRLNPGEEPERVFSGPAIIDVAPRGVDGTAVLVASHEAPGWKVFEVAPGGNVREVASLGHLEEGRAIALLDRGGTLWVSVDHSLVAIEPDGVVEVLGHNEGIGSGGPLFTDREGSLWMGTFLGLLQFPEPDTRIFAERQGLPSPHARFVTRTGDVLWAVTWRGVGGLRRSSNGWNAFGDGGQAHVAPCVDAQGSAWSGDADRILEWRGPEVIGWPGPGYRGAGTGRCVADRFGGVWMDAGGGLRYLDPERTGWRAIEPPPEERGGGEVRPALHDADDRIWIQGTGRICHAPARELVGGGEGGSRAWSCEPIPDADLLRGRMVSMGDEVWAVSIRHGLLRRSGRAWTPAGFQGIPVRGLFTLVPSPRGGVWLVGQGVLARVRLLGNGEIEVVERLSGWHGVPGGGAGDLFEEEDGTIWLATALGVVRVPSGVRFAEPHIPSTALVEVRVDDHPLPVDSESVLAHDQNRIEVRFAALTFRDPSAVRHQARLGPGVPWVESTGDPVFRWGGLRPGRYRVEYRASLDGVSWSESPAGYAFRVRPPWFRTPWVRGGLLLLTVGLAWLLYRARVAYLVGLERQRTRIAMDLHDEVGSGLASVGILSGVLASDGLDPGERRGAAREIARSAEELGHSLSDIVWSLDPGSGTLRELANRLAEHGRRLLADAETEFRVRSSGVEPSLSLSEEHRRNVLLVGLEALHNAARHSGAGRVEVALRPLGGGFWELSVRDDGTGFSWSGAPVEAGGLGLRTMKARAAAIGGELRVDSRPGFGTEVVLRFPVESTPKGVVDRLTRSLGLYVRRTVRRIPRIRGRS